MKNTNNDFWDGVRKSAKAVQNGPAWLKAGISLNPKHFETYDGEYKRNI